MWICSGVVPLKAGANVAYDERSVALPLSRKLKLPAKVHGAYGADPATMPMDMERVLPLLGFYGLEVQPAPSPKL